MPWDALGGLRVDRRNGVHAVLTTAARSHPAVRTRDLHQLAVASGGRCPTPPRSERRGAVLADWPRTVDDWSTPGTDSQRCRYIRSHTPSTPRTGLGPLPDPAGDRRAGPPFPRDHPRPQHGRRPRALARHRHGRRRLRQADRRDRELLHPVRARPRAPQDLGDLVADAIREAGGVPREFNTIAVDDGIAMGHGGMLYSLPSPRADRRRGRVHGQRALRRRAGLHLQLRQDHAGHARSPRCGSTSRRSSSPAARWRPARRSSSTASRTHRLDLITAIADVGRRRRSTDAELARHRGVRLPDLRLLLRHVHRQLDELPDRGARPGAARQRLDAGHPRRPPGAVRGAGAHRRRPAPALLRPATTTSRAAPRDRHARRVRERDGPGRRDGRLDQHRAAPAGRRAGGARSTSTLADIDAVSRRVPCLCKVAPNGDLPHGGRAPRRRHPGDPRRAAPRRPAATRTSTPCTPPRSSDVARRRGTSAAATPPGGASSCSTPRPAACAPTEAFSQSNRWETLDTDAADGCIRDVAHAYTRRRRPGHPVRQPRPGRLRRQDRRRRRVDL